MVARVANVYPRNRGQPHLLVFRQHQLRNSNVAQNRALKAVARPHRFRPFTVERLFDLHGYLTEFRGKDRVLRGPFRGKAEQRTPGGSVKAWIRVGQRTALIQSREHKSNRSRFRAAAKITPGKTHGKARPDKTLLARAELTTQANRRKSRQSHRARGNVPAARNHFQATTDVQRIAPRFMHLDDNLFALLPFDGTQRADARPIEYPQVIQIALGIEELSFAQLLIFFNAGVGDAANELRSSALRPDQSDLVYTRLLPRFDRVHHIHQMRILGIASRAGIKMRI